MNLKSRWINLMSELALPENLGTFQSLKAAYSEPHRHYHNIDHLKSVLTQLDEVEPLADCKCNIELALWFHDAVYQPFSSCNEADSADWAAGFLEHNGVAESIRGNVVRLILATSHTNEANSNDEKLIIDIDLSVLGQSSECYKSFAAGVRLEHKRVPGFIYRRKRKTLLRNFLKRDRIYYFKTFNEVFEDRARDNLKSEILKL